MRLPPKAQIGKSEEVKIFRYGREVVRTEIKGGIKVLHLGPPLAPEPENQISNMSPENTTRPVVDLRKQATILAALAEKLQPGSTKEIMEKPGVSPFQRASLLTGLLEQLSGTPPGTGAVAKTIALPSPVAPAAAVPAPPSKPATTSAASGGWPSRAVCAEIASKVFGMQVPPALSDEKLRGMLEIKCFQSYFHLPGMRSDAALEAENIYRTEPTGFLRVECATRREKIETILSTPTRK